jgi:hypothetical protein
VYACPTSMTRAASCNTWASVAVDVTQVRRQFEAHCRSFESRLRGKASRAIAMWRGVAMQAVASSQQRLL